ncbi:hypothetical protein MKW94_003463, partial [Papaver nudicaule]|nr:hypothetical protein [Papaver nudicaule]
RNTIPYAVTSMFSVCHSFASDGYSFFVCLRGHKHTGRYIIYIEGTSFILTNFVIGMYFVTVSCKIVPRFVYKTMNERVLYLHVHTLLWKNLSLTRRASSLKSPFLSACSPDDPVA